LLFLTTCPSSLCLNITSSSQPSLNTTQCPPAVKGAVASSYDFPPSGTPSNHPGPQPSPPPDLQILQRQALGLTHSCRLSTCTGPGPVEPEEMLTQ
jgi:hypothetical protein